MCSTKAVPCRQSEGGSTVDALKILVVDDEARMRKLVKDFLTNKGFSVIEAGDGEEAVDIFFAQKDISLVLLDVMMPKMDGWEVLKTIRKYSQVPVIMLTARSEERDELQGFSLGVDEYISKPFSPKILVARVDAILRRSNVVSTENMSVGGICIDKAAHQVTIDGREIELSYKEFELLSYFIENQGIALSREKILNNVWNYDYFGDARTARFLSFFSLFRFPEVLWINALVFQLPDRFHNHFLILFISNPIPAVG